MKNNHLSNLSDQHTIPIERTGSLRTLYEQHRDIFHSFVQQDTLTQSSLNDLTQKNISFQAPATSRIRPTSLISREIQTDNVNLSNLVKCSGTSAILPLPNVSTCTTASNLLPSTNFLANNTSSASTSLVATSDSLPIFKGRSDEKPSKFLRDFKLLAQAYVGDSDEAFLRAVRPSLRDTVLTWFGQLQE